MVEYYISSIAKYTYADDKFYKNGIPLLDENGDDINEILFKRFIKKETANFIHQNYSNIIVLIGAGASVLCRNNAIDKRFGKTVAMLADLINTELKQNSQYYSLQELSNFCKYTIPVEIAGDDAELKLNPAFNLEDFLSDLLSFEKYVSSSDYDKYVLSKNKILELIVSNTSYEYDNSCLKHSAFINTVSHLVRTPSKLTMVTTNYDTLIEDAADSIEYTVIDGFTFTHRPHFDSDMFEWNLVKDIANIKTREMEYKKNITPVYNFYK